MPSIEQIDAWSVEEILGEIRRLLTPGLSFVEATKEGWATGSFQQPSKEEGSEPVILWSNTNADRRIMLLNAFGWLWLRNQKPKHPAWKPRPGGQPARRHPSPLKFQDPPDLDPEHIRAVYEKDSKGKN